MVEVAPGTVVVHTDVFCGWSMVASHRFPRSVERVHT
jgi:hypothetical protein